MSHWLEHRRRRHPRPNDNAKGSTTSLGSISGIALTAPGRLLTRRLGLPQPARLRRWSAEQPTLQGRLLHLTAGKSDLDLAPVLALAGLDLDLVPAGSALDLGTENPVAVVLDATGVHDVDSLAEVHAARGDGAATQSVLAEVLPRVDAIAATIASPALRARFLARRVAIDELRRMAGREA